jgi:hypothetical protein
MRSLSSKVLPRCVIDALRGIEYTIESRRKHHMIRDGEGHVIASLPMGTRHDERWERNLLAQVRRRLRELKGIG